MLLPALIVMVSFPAAPSPVISVTLSYSWFVTPKPETIDAVGPSGPGVTVSVSLPSAVLPYEPLRGVGPDVEAEDAARLTSPVAGRAACWGPARRSWPG